LAGIQTQHIPLASAGAVHELQALTPWDLDLRVLKNGSSPGSIEAISTGRMMIQKYRFAWKLHQRGAPPHGMRAFGIGVEPTPNFPWCGHTLEDEWLVAFPVDNDFECVSNDAFHAYGLHVDEQLLEDTAVALGIPGLAGLPTPASVFTGGQVSAVRVILRRIFQAVRQPSLDVRQQGLARAIEWDLAVQLLRSLVKGRRATTPRLRERDHALRKCMDFVERTSGQVITVRELLDVAHVSWRTLDYAFKERFGMTPQAFLRVRRLNAVRSDLIDATPAKGTISTLAGRWDFWHLGDFARDYQRLFGERPSDTLRLNSSASSLGRTGDED
jgi:AraC-like DNA-binding protein